MMCDGFVNCGLFRGYATTSRLGLPRATSRTKKPCKMPKNSSKWSVCSSYLHCGKFS